MNRRAKYPRQKVIAIDVDGTLIDSAGQTNERVAEFAREKKAAGFEVWLWSARGKRHAAQAAKNAGLTDVFDHILSKPGYTVDDQGWRWVRFTHVITDAADL